MKKELLMKHKNERLHVSSSQKRSNKRGGDTPLNRAAVRRLAKLARGFILTICVGVAKGLHIKHDEQSRQGKSQHPCQVMRRLALADHLDSVHYPKCLFDARDVP